MALTNCPECSNQVSDQATSCPKCGCPIKSGVSISVPVQKTKNRSAAILLALLLGGLGIHKFYVEKPGAGLVYLLFCWTFIPIILGFIEAIQYLCMNEETFQKKYREKKL